MLPSDCCTRAATGAGYAVRVWGPAWRLAAQGAFRAALGYCRPTLSAARPGPAPHSGACVSLRLSTDIAAPVVYLLHPCTGWCAAPSPVAGASNVLRHTAACCSAQQHAVRTADLCMQLLEMPCPEGIVPQSIMPQSCPHCDCSGVFILTQTLPNSSSYVLLTHLKQNSHLFHCPMQASMQAALNPLALQIKMAEVARSGRYEGRRRPRHISRTAAGQRTRPGRSADEPGAAQQPVSGLLCFIMGKARACLPLQCLCSGCRLLGAPGTHKCTQSIE